MDFNLKKSWGKKNLQAPFEIRIEPNCVMVCLACCCCFLIALKLFTCHSLCFLSLTFQEMLDIMTSIYDMMGKYTYPTMQDDAPREHVESFFQVQPSLKILISPRIKPAPNCRGTTERVIVLTKNVDVVRLRVIHQRLTAFFVIPENGQE